MEQDYSPTESAEQQIDRIKDSRERRLWAGRPNADAMKKGTGHGASRTNWIMLIVGGAIIAAVGSAAYKGGQLGVSGLTESFNWPLVGIVAFTLFTIGRHFLKNRSDVENWAEGLTYGITDRRLLVLRDGVIEREYSISEVNQPVLVDRQNAPGYSDIIWGQTAPEMQSGNRGHKRTARQTEELRVGFKALSDGEAVMEKTGAWRTAHLQESAEKAEAFVSSVREDSSERHQIRNSTHRFSIEVPDTWDLMVRHRRLVFGKWGIEKEAQWGTEKSISDWNVLRVEADVGSYVELQVHETKPINTLDDMLNSKAAQQVGLTKVIDQNADFELSGMRGFYLTRERRGRSNAISTGQTQDVSTWHMRQYILHDGQRQYYFETVWPADSDAQRDICTAIVATLKSQ